VVGIAISAIVFLVACRSATKDAIAVAREYALAQKAGESEFGGPLSLGEPAATEAGNGSTCVVFRTLAPPDARVGVLVRPIPAGWEGWFVRASPGTALDCERMLLEARLLNTDLTPYVR
jgi:hypothetical protein